MEKQPGDHPAPATGPVDASPQHERDRLRWIVEALTEVVALDQPVEALLERIVDAAMRMTSAEGAVVELVDGDEMEYAAATGSIREHQGLRLDRDSSLSGLCVARARLQYARDTETDPRVDREACRRIGARSMLLVPLLHQGQPVGVIKVVARRPDAFDAIDEYALRLSAGLIGGAIGRQLAMDENARLVARHAQARNAAAAVLAAAPTALIVHDLDGGVLAWNPAAEHLLGWREDEVLGRPPPYLEPGELPGFLATTGRMAAGDGGGEVVRRRRRDGASLSLRVGGAPLRDADGRVTGIVRSLEDIGEQRAMAEQLRAATERLRAVTDRASDAFLSLDASGRVIEWNAHAEQWFGWSRQQVLLRPLAGLLVHGGDSGPEEALRRLLQGAAGPGLPVELRVRCRDGSEARATLSVHAARANGEPVFDAFLRPPGAADAAEAPLQSGAPPDPLTGLPGRADFEAAVATALQRAAPGQTAVVLVDPEGFQAINDLYGPATGDALLQAVARRLGETVRAQDTVARMDADGDAFGVLVEGLRDPEHDVRRVVEKLVAALDEPMPLRGHPLPLAMRFGVAVHERPDDSACGLLQRAAGALEAARAEGSGQVRLHLGGKVRR